MVVEKKSSLNQDRRNLFFENFLQNLSFWLHAKYVMFRKEFQKLDSVVNFHVSQFKFDKISLEIFPSLTSELIFTSLEKESFLVIFFSFYSLVLKTSECVSVFC